MRLTAFILAVLILVLSIWPCAEAHSHMKSSVKYEMKKSMDHEQDHIDLCSPFCHCSCSTLVIAPQSSVSQFLSVTNYLVQDRYREYISTGEINVHIPVWQPPRS